MSEFYKKDEDTMANALSGFQLGHPISTVLGLQGPFLGLLRMMGVVFTDEFSGWGIDE